MAGFPLINLPSYQATNSLNFQPISDAIESINQNALAQRQMGLQEQRNALMVKQDDRDAQMHGVKLSAMQREQGMAEARQAAGRIQYIQSLPPEQQAAAWQQTLQMPGFKDLPPDQRDFSRAAPLILSKAAEYMDPLTKQKTQAEIGLMGSKSALARAQAAAAGQKSSLDEALGGMIRGMAPQSAPAPAPQGGIQPQSFGGSAPQSGVMPVAGPQAAAGPPQGDPNLILAQTAQPAPQGAPDLSPGQDMVDTPFGRMTRQKAQQLGMAMALGGKGDAGKMMGEFAQQGMPGKEARNEIEKRLFAATEQKARLSAIRQTFKPEWQTLDEQLKQYGISWIDSIGPLRDRIPPEQRQRHAEYTRYRQEAFMNMNQYIKDMTGAAMSEMEANRLRKGIPDPERDGPTAFQTKMEQSSAQADLAMARHTYLLRKGFQGNPWESGVSLERMQNIINERGAQIEKIMRQQNPQAPPQAIQRETFRLVKQEFGI